MLKKNTWSKSKFTCRRIYIYIYVLMSFDATKQFVYGWHIYVMFVCVYIYGLSESHGNLLLAVFYLINRCSPYRWVVLVSWLNYVIPAVDLWGSTTQHQVQLAVDLILGSSTILHIQYAASHGFWSLTSEKNIPPFYSLSFNLVKVQLSNILFLIIFLLLLSLPRQFHRLTNVLP